MTDLPVDHVGVLVRHELPRVHLPQQWLPFLGLNWIRIRRLPPRLHPIHQVCVLLRRIRDHPLRLTGTQYPRPRRVVANDLRPTDRGHLAIQQRHKLQMAIRTGNRHLNARRHAVLRKRHDGRRPVVPLQHVPIHEGHVLVLWPGERRNVR